VKSWDLLARKSLKLEAVKLKISWFDETCICAYVHVT